MKRQITITDQLRSHAKATPDRVAYVFLRDDGRIDQFTYKELYDQATGLAAALLDHAPPGSRALLLFPSGLEFIKVYMACLYAGIVAVPATMARKARPSQRLTAILRDADPALLLTTADCLQAVTSGCFPDDLAGRACLATDGIAAPAKARKLPEIHGDAVAFLQYTSGSVETPKGVVITHRNIISNVHAIEQAFGFSSSSVMVGWLPLFHDMGLIGNVLSPLYAGFKSVLMSPAAFLKNPLLWLQAITKYRGTCAGAPNFGWDYCIDRISPSQKKELDLSSLAIAYNGAEPVRSDTLLRLHEAFAGCGLRQEALFPCYGMAEATLFVAGGSSRKAPVILSVSKNALESNQVRAVPANGEEARQVVSCGRVARDLSLIVVDPETRLPCSRRRVGEIWVAGASVGKGYWNLSTETERTFNAYLADSAEGPYLRTGDLGFVQDGEVFVTGRLKDLVIINGRNIYPQDIEQVIESSIDFIGPNMCAAFSVEVKDRECLAIVAEANRTLMRAASLEQKHGAREQTPARGRNGYLTEIDRIARDICKVIAEQLEVAVSTIVFVRPGTFPKTSSGKVQRLRCRRLALDGKLDIVYVTSGSIFDRREARDRREAAILAEGRAAAEADDLAENAERGAEAVALRAPAAHESKAKADAMIAWFRDYAARRLNSRLIDERRTIPPYVVLDLGNKGFFGLQVPVRFGGAELATKDLLRVMEQLAGVDLTVAMLVGIHNGLGVRPILEFASEAARQALLPELAAGRQLAAFAITEPGAGSNPLAMSATAEQVPGGWLLNAEKQWTGLGSWAGRIVVFAKAVDAAGAQIGVIALAVPEDAPGLSQGPEALTMGVRGIVQNTLYLNDVFVPDDAVLGKPGEGMAVGQDAMMFSRLGIGAICIGALKRCAQLMARYASNRRVSTGMLADNPVTLMRLADLTGAIYAAEALVYQIAAMLDGGDPAPVEAYLACKTVLPELLSESADQLVQLLGGRGYIESNIAPQLVRDARVLRILEGPTETLCMHLGASVLRRHRTISELVSTALGAPAVFDEVVAAVEELEAAAQKGGLPFSDATACDQWLQFQAGKLAASAVMLAAAQKRQSTEKDVRGNSAQAVEWARRRFAADRQEAMAACAGPRRLLTSGALLGIIDGYEAAIGDVEQRLAGENHALDDLLRREPQTVAATGPQRGASSNGRPALAYDDHAGPPARAPAALVQRSADPDKYADAARVRIASAVGSGALAKSAATVELPAPAQASDLDAIKRVLQDCALEWLRSEKKRAVNEVDTNMPFASLGMDSLGAVSFMLEIEQRTGVSLNPEIVYEYSTIDELAVYLGKNFTVEAGSIAAASFAR